MQLASFFFLVAALTLFVLAALRVTVGRLDCIGAGLALVVLAEILTRGMP